MKRRSVAWLMWTFVAISGCAERPVLYPNPHLEKVGNEAAQKDIDECIRMAEEGGAKFTSKTAEVAKDTAEGAIIGGAVGTAAGAVLGELGRGAAAGAAGGAAAGMTRGILHSERDPVLKNYVDRCLREKGYDPIGWR
ncbi:MAG: hypothetical protein C4576_33645 [Desulfobacteraceae bacterium]|nr:MAG: hypothetical protein C4576_33645 [Desulfobacteraceae bacterium]